jgi:hypothetical protein
MKKSMVFLGVLGFVAGVHAEDELQKRDAYRDKVAWQCAAVPTIAYGALKAYAPHVITKMVSVMPAAVAKFGASTLAYTAPCVVPAVGLMFVYLVVRDMLAESKASPAPKQSEDEDKSKQVAPKENAGVMSLYKNFCVHTGRNLKNLAIPVACSLLGLGYSF